MEGGVHRELTHGALVGLIALAFALSPVTSVVPSIPSSHSNDRVGDPTLGAYLPGPDLRSPPRAGTGSPPRVVTNISLGKGIGEDPQTPVFDSASGDLFVANEGSDSVSVINGATQAVIRVVPTGPGPSTPVLDPVNDELYVSDGSWDDVTVISAATDGVVGTLVVGMNPQQGVYDAVNNEIYVPNLGSNSVSVIQGSSNTVVATIPLDFSPTTPGVDPANGLVYVPTYYVNESSNYGNLSIVSPSLNTVLATDEVGDDPQTPVYDPSDGEMYVADALSGNVTVIDDLAVTDTLTFLVAETSPVFVPQPVNALVFVSSNNLTVANASTNAMVNVSVNLGNEPSTPILDTGTRNLYLANYLSSNVSVVSPTTWKIVTTVKVGVDPLEPAYDPTNGDVYVPNDDANTLSVISDSTGKVVSTVATLPSPGVPVVDTSNADLYMTAGTNQTSIAIVSGGSNTLLNTLPVSGGLVNPTFDPSNGDVYFGNYWGRNISILSGYTNTLAGTLEEKLAFVASTFDPDTGTIYFTAQNTTNESRGEVLVLSGETNQELEHLQVGGVWGVIGYNAMTFDPSNQDLYQPDALTRNVTEINGTIGSKETTSIGGTGLWTITPTYDPLNHDLYVPALGGKNVSVVSGATNTIVTKIYLGGSCPSCGSLAPLIGAFDPSNGDLYFSERGVDMVVVVSGTTNKVVASIPVGLAPQSATYDPTDQEVYVSNADSNNVSVINGTSNTVVASLPVGAFPLQAVYDPVSTAVYVPNAGSGSLSVIETEAPPLVITQSYAEPSAIDLGQTTSLHVTAVGGQGPYLYAFSSLPRGCSSQNISVLNCTPTGEGQFTVGVTVTTPASGTVSSALSLEVNQSVSSVSLTPNGTISLKYGSSQEFVLLSRNSTGATDTPSTVTWEVSPTWLGTVGPGSGSSNAFTAGSAAGEGRLWVNASLNGWERGAWVEVLVSPAGAPVISAFSSNPSQISLGETTNLSVQVTGGNPPLTFAYVGLPPGCLTSDRSSLLCTPTASGNYTIEVQVVDVDNDTVSLATNLEVTPALPLASVLLSPASPLRATTRSTQVFTVVAEDSAGRDVSGVKVTWALSPSSLGQLNQTSGNSVQFTAGSNLESGTLWVNGTLAGVTKGASVSIQVVASSGGRTSSSYPLGLGLGEWIAILLVILILAVAGGYLYLGSRVNRRQTAAGTPSDDVGSRTATRTGEGEEGPPRPLPTPSWPMAPLSVAETTDPGLFWQMVSKSGLDRDRILIFCVEGPGEISAQYGLAGAKFYRVVRTEGDDNIAPGDVDRMGFLIEDHFQKGAGRSVVFQGVVRVADHAGLRATSKLLQISREVAEATRGAMVICLDPSSVKLEELRILEEDSQVLRLQSPMPPPRGSSKEAK